jgi:ribose-phosphate pyrophosphokinase
MAERTFGYGPKLDMSRVRLFTGNSNVELVEKIAGHLKTPIGKSVVKTFSDGEINVDQ